MRFSDKKKSKAPVINITSLIDVMFLLVIFLLVTAKYDTESGIPVDLPKVKAEEAPRIGESFTVTVLHDGSVFLDKNRVEITDLKGAVEAVRKKMKDPILYIRCDGASESQRLIEVLAVVRAAGQERISFNTKQ